MSALASSRVPRPIEQAAPFRGGTGVAVQRSAVRLSSPGDPAEHEASHVAHAVVSMPAPAPPAARIAHAGGGIVRRQPVPLLQPGRSGSDTIHRSTASAPPVAGDVSARIQGSLSDGAPLPGSVRRFMEPRFGASFANVRIHTDANAASLSRQVAAHAFTTGNHIFFARDRFAPDTADGRELIAHELTHTIQQGAVVREPGAVVARQEDLTITPQPGGVVQRLGFSDIVDGLANLAANVPGFTLLTLIIGRNPINLRPVERSAVNVLRAFMGLIPGGEILFQVLNSYRVIERLGAWVLQQTGALGLSYQSVRDAFSRFVDTLGWRDIFSPGDVWRRAREVFTPTLTRIGALVSGLVSQAIAWLKDTFMEPLSAFCREIPGYGLVTVMLGRDPFTNAPVPRTALTVVRAFAEFIPGGTEKVNQLVQSGALERAYAWFTQETQARNLTWTRVTGTFAQAWASLRLDDVLRPLDTLRRMISLFRPLMTDLVGFAGAALVKLLELIFEAVMGAGGARILAILKRARATFLIIINDPVGFLRNLLGAVGQGVRQFMANILAHLRDGVIAWLTGPVAAAGIQMPERWDLRGIIGFVLQILGLTWARVRGKLVRLMGERAVGLLEAGFQLILDIRDRGLVQALRDRVTEFFGSLREAALGAIRSFIQTRLVQAGITQLLSLLSPVGAVIQAIIKTYTTIQFFIQRINQILDLVESVLNSIAAIAAGAIGAAANFVERTMARTIPVILDFLARFIGLGDVGAQVQTTIRNLQASVDRMLDRAVDWIRNQVQRLAARDASPDGAMRAPVLAALSRELRSEHSVADAEAILRRVAELYRPQGVRRLTLAPSNPDGSRQILVETNPTAPIAMLRPRGAVPAGRAVRANIELTLRPTIPGSPNLPRAPGAVSPIGTVPGAAGTTSGPAGTAFHQLASSHALAVTRSRGNRAIGGIVLVPEGDRVQVVTWNTSSLALDRRGNDTHAERQFDHWLDQLRADPEGVRFLQRVVGIAMHLRDYSPCGMCIDTLRGARQKLPSDAAADLYWYRLYPGTADPTTWAGLRGLSGWRLHAPGTAMPPETNDQGVRVYLENLPR